MAQVGKNSATGWDKQHGVSPVIQVGDTGGLAVWIRVLRNARGNDEGGGGHLCGVNLSDNGEEGEVVRPTGHVRHW